MCQMCSLWIILDVQDQMMNVDIEIVLFIWLLLWYEPRTTVIVKSVLRDHCHERPPVLIDHTIFAEGPTFQYNWTCAPETNCLDRTQFCGQWGGPLYQWFNSITYWSKEQEWKKLQKDALSYVQSFYHNPQAVRHTEVTWDSAAQLMKRILGYTLLVYSLLASNN